MRLYFKKIRIHNFLSINDAEVQLDNRGYVLVKGMNNNPKDNAASNGSGKSTIFNAICWVMTGETIQGLKTNIPNIYGEDGCFVELQLMVDANEYVITRYREYKNKSDLKIFINGEDHSGKSLRDSEKLLAQYLPGITPDLIGNVIILGQGLPHKFSNNTPSGRKEILEQLSNSDVMINDVKDRVSRRFEILEAELRAAEDARLKLNTEISLVDSNKVRTQAQLDNMQSDDELKNKISSLKVAVETLTINVKGNKSIKDSIYIELNRLQSELNTLIQDKQRMIDEALTPIENDKSIVTQERIKLQSKINSLSTEILKLESVVDVCPTCGQKLPDVHKIDTTDKHQELDQLRVQMAKVDEQIKSISELYASTRAEVESNFKDELDRVNGLISSNRGHASNLEILIDQDSNKLNKTQVNLANAEMQLETYRDQVDRLQSSIAEFDLRRAELDADLISNQLKLDDISKHIATLNQIKTLVNRDFRGLLLSHVIDFINAKAKQYCTKVFGTDELNMYLEGNNINIDFCNKSLENLSGGEQQKINLIIQFAIRNMMCQYLNFSSNILVLDEIFDQLDLTGCSSIIDLISFAISDVESLFVISHHSDELNIPYDDKLVVTKNEMGVSTVI